LGTGTLERLPEVLNDLAVRGTIGLVTDSSVGPLYARRVRQLVEDSGRICVTHTLPAGETYKRLEQVENICGTFLQGRLDRTSLVLALGGGVVGDVAGFAAASFMRGVPCIQIPTTIVAQVDSSVGGKTGVNHPLGKNTIGAFHQPRAVLIDMTLLETLPERELCAGVAEIIKHGVIADAALFAYMERESDPILAKDLAALEYPIRRSCEIKAEIVAEDEFEQGRRANLNYGHTFGHAIEAVSEYRLFLHGEAVALGMCAAAALAHALGIVPQEFVTRQRHCLQAYGLPTRWLELPVDAALEAMHKDKKVRAGLMKFILPTEIGTVVHRTDVQEDQARRALESLRVE
ncbi:MAG: 3-dehydroquinate synthase, partial [Candidatus Hydrogenedentes bacterium]|nr:3-dehydroquinate synthase [Candidatus Hydrogenedentota bacterium]